MNGITTNIIYILKLKGTKDLFNKLF